MSDTPTFTEADLQELPDPVPSKQVAAVLGVKPSALRMVVKRGALDPPTSVGTNISWYAREAVVRAWHRRQPDHIHFQPATAPKNAEQNEVGTEIAAAPALTPAKLLQFLEASSEAQMTLAAKVETLTEAVQRMADQLAEERAARAREAERLAQRQAEHDRKPPSLWDRLRGRGHTTDGA